MRTGRLEAFSDGVLAIIITIMVLELKVPQGHDFSDLGVSSSSLLAYLVSFIYVGIYWNNHHHLFHLVERVTGGVLWANLHLLFWLSLVPFSTTWFHESHEALAPTVMYGLNLLGAGFAYFVLSEVLCRSEGPSSLLVEARGADVKGRISLVLYLVGIGGSFVTVWVGVAMYIVVAAIWLVPDRRLERLLRASP